MIYVTEFYNMKFDSSTPNRFWTINFVLFLLSCRSFQNFNAHCAYILNHDLKQKWNNSKREIVSSYVMKNNAVLFENAQKM